MKLNKPKSLLFQFLNLIIFIIISIWYDLPELKIFILFILLYIFKFIVFSL